MSADTSFSSAAALRLLVSLAGWRRLALLAGLMVLASLTEGVGLLLLVPVTAMVAGETGAMEGFAWLTHFTGWPAASLLALVVLVVIVRAVIVFAAMTQRRTLGMTMTRRLREDCHAAIIGAEWRWLSGQNSADHAALITGESARVGNLADHALSIGTASATLVVLFTAAAALSWPLALAALAVGAVAGLLVARASLGRRRVGEDYSDAYRAMQRHVANGLAHLRAARIGGGQQRLGVEFAGIAQRLSEVEQRYYRTVDQTRLLFQVIAVAALALLVWVMLFRFATPVAVVVPMLAIFARAVPLISGLYQSVRQWHFDLPALQSVMQTIEAARCHAEPAGTIAELPALTRELALRSVTVSFAGRSAPILQGFDLVIPVRSVIGVTGPSGSGKSTLADILAGLLSPDKGHVLIDGKPLGPPQRLAWRGRVAYVEQHPFLIEGTIEENVAWGGRGMTRHQSALRWIRRRPALSMICRSACKRLWGKAGVRFQVVKNSDWRLPARWCESPNC
ncbi:MAG: ABC transporter ATP-binding protein [Caenibius sp.]